MIVDAPRPANTLTDVYDSVTVELVDNVPTEVWQSRPWTQEELASQVYNQLAVASVTVG